MKHIHADKIMQFAKMVEAGHPIDELVQIVDGNYQWKWNGLWLEDKQYRVAIAFVEGKPVFVDDYLYVCGMRMTILSTNGNLATFKNHRDLMVLEGIDLKSNSISWNPPKSPELNPPRPLTFADAVTSIRNGFCGKVMFTDGEYNWIVTSVRRDLYTDCKEITVREISKNGSC